MSKGMMNYAKQKRCSWCGKDYIARTCNSKYCSPECKEAGNAAMKAIYNANRKDLYHAKKERSTALTDISNEARKLGMSYGQYVALKGI